jgi:hypothetical protein
VLLVQVTSPAGGTPPHDGTVLLQLDSEDGRREVVSGAVQANGVAQLRFDPTRGRGVLHYSGPNGQLTRNKYGVRRADILAEAASPHGAQRLRS